MADQYYLPPQTAELLDKGVAGCKNLGLILDKYVPQDVIEKNENKGPWLKYLVQEQSHVFDAELFQAVALRQRRMLANIRGIHTFSAALAWRMIVGLGGESVLETDLTLHHLYGVPIIPGSALKGLTRAYAAAEEKEYFITNSEGQANSESGGRKGFRGSSAYLWFPEEGGSVTFFDALPVDTNISIVVDIMNPHYPNYYKSLKKNTIPPTNDQAPIPIPFLTVAETAFLFALAPSDASDKEHPEDIGLALSWLKSALQKYGVGGKTSAGYGYFELSDELQSMSLVEDVQVANEPTQKVYERPKIPLFREGQEIKGAVVPATDELRKIAPEAQAFMRYELFILKDVLLVVNAEEAQTWKPGDTRICLFVREEVREGYTILSVSAESKEE